MYTPQIVLETREKVNKVFYDGRVIPRHTDTQHFYEDAEDGSVYASATTKTGMLSRDYYKTMAANKAVEVIESHLMFNAYDEAQMTEVYARAREAHVVDLKQAGTWGTHGHDLVDRYVTRWIETSERPADIKEFVTPEISNEGICVGLSAMKFFDEYTLFPIVSEKKVLSKKYRYAGTLDSLFVVGTVYKERVGQKDCKHDWFDRGHDKIHCLTCGREVSLAVGLLDWKSSNSIMHKHEYGIQIGFYAQALKEMCGIKTKINWIVRLDKKTPSYEIGVVDDINKAIKACVAMNTLADYAEGKTIEPLFVKEVIKI